MSRSAFEGVRQPPGFDWAVVGSRCGGSVAALRSATDALAEHAVSQIRAAGLER